MLQDNYKWPVKDYEDVIASFYYVNSRQKLQNANTKQLVSAFLQLIGIDNDVKNFPNNYITTDLDTVRFILMRIMDREFHYKKDRRQSIVDFKHLKTTLDKKKYKTLKATYNFQHVFFTFIFSIFLVVLKFLTQ